MPLFSISEEMKVDGRRPVGPVSRPGKKRSGWEAFDEHPHESISNCKKTCDVLQP